MDNQKFEIIIDRLLELSEEEKLNWKTTANPDKYLLSLNDSSITVSYSSGFTADSVFLEFKNEKGETVEKIEIRQADNITDFNKTNKLYDLARRKALNADETIDRILEQLNPDLIVA